MSEKKTVLVTGGAGYIGSHACKALAASGYNPVVYDNMSFGHEWAVKWGALVRGDILDRHQLDNAIAQYNPDAIMHFAAFAYVGESVEKPGKYYRNNVAGTLTLLEAARDAGLKHVVFSSTCATYGLPVGGPIDEGHPQNPINPYGASKLMAERMLLDFDLAYGMKSVALRYFNAAGADLEGDIGEDHDPETHLIPLVLDAAAKIRPGISVFGGDYDTPDGTCIRDYIHVNDLADAHVKALQFLIREGRSAAFNLGIGEGYSVREVIESAERVTGRKVERSMEPRRAGDPGLLVSDASKARKELGWAPEITGIDEIIKSAWVWHKAHRNGSLSVERV